MALGIAGKTAVVEAASKGLGKVCAFLCSVHVGFMVGQNLLMDGGAHPGNF